MIPVGRRLGVMGGTFDPIHHGHLVAAAEARWKFRLDEVRFIPAGRPWMKGHRALADGEDRLRMTELATQDEPAFTVSRMELDREGPTHTVETLRALREHEPDTELYFVTGADAIADLPQWSEPSEALELATFIAATRPGTDLQATLEGLTSELGAEATAAIEALEVPALAISSSDIRERVSQGRPFRYLVPDAVHDMIDEQGLYR